MTARAHREALNVYSGIRNTRSYLQQVNVGPAERKHTKVIFGEHARVPNNRRSSERSLLLGASQAELSRSQPLPVRRERSAARRVGRPGMVVTRAVTRNGNIDGRNRFPSEPRRAAGAQIVCTNWQTDGAAG